METACVPDTPPPDVVVPRWLCQFPDYPGTIIWKPGFLAHRNGFVKEDGTEFGPTEANLLAACRMTGECRRRFDNARRDIFHYALFAHATGEPKSPLPGNPDFHVPRPISGKGDYPGGGDLLITLGLWDAVKYVGSEDFAANTVLHELGHNGGRSHGGDPVAQPDNCKPNYVSVMNYLFQLSGPPDYSGVARSAMRETRLADGSLVSLGYQTGMVRAGEGAHRRAGNHHLGRKETL